MPAVVVKSGFLNVLNSLLLPKRGYAVLSSTGNGLLRFALYRSEDEASTSIPALVDITVTNDAVRPAARGFVIAKLGVMGTRYTEFACDTDEEADSWLHSLAAVKLDASHALGSGQLSADYLWQPHLVPGRPIARMLYKMAQGPMTTAQARVVHHLPMLKLENDPINWHASYAHMTLQWDRVGLDAMLLRDALLYTPLGETLKGSEAVLERLYRYTRTLKMVEMGVISGDERATHCVVTYMHHTFQISLRLQETLEWHRGQVKVIRVSPVDEDMRARAGALLRIQREYTQKVHELLKEPLPFSFVREQEDALMSTFEMGAQLGSGNFGSVKLGRNKATGQVRAIKCIPTSKQDKDALEAEIKIMRAANDAVGDLSCVVKLFETYQSKDYYYLVMEHVSGGELFDRILEEGSFSERSAQGLMRQLLAGVSKLHLAGIIHRDLKPENLLFSSRSPNASVKIADFGLSCFFTDIFHEHRSCGSPPFMAPELVTAGEACYLDGRGMPRRLYRTYGPAVDVWACGCILYLLLSGQPAFKPVWRPSTQCWDLDHLFLKIWQAQLDFSDKVWKRVSPEAIGLLTSMLKANQSLRITATAALEHPWMGAADLPSTPSQHVADGIATHQKSMRSNKFDAHTVLAARQRTMNTMVLKEFGTFKSISRSFGDWLREIFCICYREDPFPEVKKQVIVAENLVTAPASLSSSS